MLGHVDGDGETQPLRRLDDGGIDADDLPPAIDERTAAVAGVQSGIGLNDVIDQMSGDATQSSPQGADDASRYRGLKTERTADGDDELADSEARRVAEDGMWQVVFLSLHDGQIGPRIVADDAAADFAAIA